MRNTFKDAERLREELERLVPEHSKIDASAAFLSSVLAHVPAIVCVVAADARLLYVSQVVPGLTVDEVLGKTVYDFMPESSHEVAREAFARVMASGEPDGYLGFGEGRGGPNSPYQNWIGPIRAGGEVVAMTLITRDVSTEWRTQRALRDREEQLSIALDAAGIGMYRFNLATRRTELDPGARAIYGIAADYFEPGDEARFMHPADLPQMAAAARRCVQNGTAYDLESRVVRSDGTTRWVHAHGVPFYDDEGTLEGMLGAIMDITERKELEERARQTQKLEAVGQLTAGIAHNFNNMLASIVPTLEMLSEDVSPENRGVLEAAAEAADRASQMVKDLLTFAGKDHRRTRRSQRVEDVIAHALRICQTTFDRQITIEVTASEHVPPVLMDAVQIEQALMNVLINARDAMREAECTTQTIRVHTDAPSEGPPGISERDHAEGWVRVTVSDSGPGVPDDVQARVFEPFFTTKEVGTGTGLGLSTSYAIVREHGGLLQLEPPSARAPGATFTIWLPAASEAPTRVLQPPPTRSSVKATHSVLVVEDERVVLRVLLRVLERAGYDVRTAGTGEESIAAIEEGGAPDVVLLDLNMPGMHYVEHIAELARIAPDAKRIVLTGQPADEPIEGVDRVLQKPIVGTALLSALREMLETEKDA